MLNSENEGNARIKCPEVPEASSATRHGTAIMRNKAASIRLKSIFTEKYAENTAYCGTQRA